MDEVQLKEWLYKMGSGDQEAFQIIYEYTCKDIYRTVVFLVGSQNQDVDDIVNEVYINMWKSITNYDINRSFRFWLHGLVVKEVQDWRRKSWRRFRIFEKKKMYEQDRPYIMDEAILHKETRSELVEVVQKGFTIYQLEIVEGEYKDYFIDRPFDKPSERGPNFTGDIKKYKLNGYDVTFGEYKESNVRAMKIVVPAREGRNAYQVYINDSMLSKKELENVLLSMIE
ncbi:hypothetical protein FOC93_06855 [Bacillus cereus]|nr:hypothetical protein BK726_25695 [Bacillus thuringiensis serovar londrina]QKH05874.1 hypothetical protein FOC93_06855 [Bacillus cereus]QKH16036.1 hypothetical protein FOC92_30635 [Bacillus cereus]HDR4713244.1 hypothetical protein [Bacillus cereus]HDR4718641.1 hypothetical protein [Bacillus cereus]